MKKLFAMLLAVLMVAGLVACGETAAPAGTTATPTTATGDATEATNGTEVALMTYEEFMAAEVDAAVCIETYVQATRAWWNNTICVYAQGPDGGYFMYDMACSEEDAAKLTPGTKIRVTGDKAIYDGEVEIMNGTFTFVEGADTYVAEAMDATELLGTEELEKHMNKLASFKGLTIKKVEYKNGAPGDDIYVTVAKGENEYSFCVEMYLTGVDSDVYKTVGTLAEGDVVDVEGFLYWYKGVNTHITAIAKAA
ncbi:MAG: hypothetical protein IJB02_02695 [Oscillospiraceae bacterium]|nr:hypothetical protein [Oscillospiraceae bacterium]